MTLPIRIIVRTATPWETMAMADFVAQTEPEKPREFIRAGRDVLPRWEEATGMSFFRYRHEIRNICQLHETSLGVPVTVGVTNIDWEGPDELLLPIDDDDVHFASATRIQVNEETNLCVWLRLTNNLGVEQVGNRVYSGTLDTCNWGIRKGFLKEWTKTQREFLLSRHWMAASLIHARLRGKTAPLTLIEQARVTVAPRSFGDLLSHPTVRQLNEPHSVYYLHSASISFLCHKMKQTQDMVGMLRKLPKHPLWEARYATG